MINLGLVGAGNFGRKFIKTINEIDGVRIRSLYSSQVENSDLIELKDDNSFNYYNEWSDLIENATQDKLDGILIVTPPNTHKKIVEECLTNGIPFLCEKPLCNNLEDTIQLCDLIDTARIPCLIDYTQLYNPAFIKLKELLNGKILTTIISSSCSNGPFRKNISMLWDWLPHNLSLIYYLNNKFEIKNIFWTPGSQLNSGRLKIWDKDGIIIKVDNISKNKYRKLLVNSQIDSFVILNNKLNFWEQEIDEKGFFKATFRSLTFDISPLTNVVNSFISVIQNKTLLDPTMTRWIAEKINQIEKQIQ